MTFKPFGLTLAATLIAGALVTLPAYAQSDASKSTITITHAQGTTEVPVNPQKVFTYDLAALDTLDALGIEVDGVPAAVYPEHLSKYAGDDYEKIGSLFEPDYEAVNAAQPDLIIVAARSSTAYEELSKIAPTIDLSNAWDNFVPSIKANSEIIGEIFSKQDEVAALEAELDAKIASVQAKAADLGSVFIVLTSGGKVTAYGPGSRFGFVHDTLGLTPAIEDVDAATHGEAISFEFILETSPDWIIAIDRDAGVGSTDGASARQTLDNALVHETNAWKNDRIVYIDPVRWYIVNGGLANLNAIAGNLDAALTAE
ncbi:siderophore ABC transporter substrate-binding protein [Cucumibacter marinus]|uniref:siderophore ABC transporter substrate-binding protein n=1 Tax=Cucumibacter marinus TaxID=1121252 RepID=UPI00040C74F5|nr:siderophore ABC transporter substrate-binding protein [Cucumibacter marinus]